MPRDILILHAYAFVILGFTYTQLFRQHPAGPRQHHYRQLRCVILTRLNLNPSPASVRSTGLELMAAPRVRHSTSDHRQLSVCRYIYTVSGCIYPVTYYLWKNWLLRDYGWL